MIRGNIPVFTIQILSNQKFVIPTRKKIRSIANKRKYKKSEMQIIGFAEFTVVSQNASHIEKSERPYQIKKSMNTGEKGNFI